MLCYVTGVSERETLPVLFLCTQVPVTTSPGILLYPNRVTVVPPAERASSTDGSS